MLRALGTGSIEPPYREHLALLLPELGPLAPTDRATLFEAIRAVLARAGPLTVLLDDMQWADSATLDLLPALARALDGEPVRLVVAYRSEDAPRLRRLRGELRRDGRLHEIRVGPFDAGETAQLLEQVLGAPAAPALRDAIFERSDGLPFYVAELAGTDAPLPENVRDAVLLRAADLSAEARAAIDVAAVAGRTFALEPVLAIAGLDALPDVGGILVDAAPGTMAFRHALVRDAFYYELGVGERRRLHSCAGIE